jgi:hypothetical protein
MASAWRHKQLVLLKCPHDFSHKRLNSMQEGPSVEANSSSTSQDISCTVWKRNVRCCFHNSVALFCVLNQMNQSHALQYCLCKINFNIILLRTLVIRIGLTLRVNMPRIYRTNLTWNYRLSDQVQ